jgi:hypothetical protein
MLVLTLVIMGVATFLIGLLPTYAQIGPWAAVCSCDSARAQGSGSAVSGGRGAHGGRARAPRTPRLLRKLAADRCSRGPRALDGSIRGLLEAARRSVPVVGMRVPFLVSAVLVGVGL